MGTERVSQAGEVPERLEDPKAVIGRLFVLAAERAGSTAALCQRLGLTHAELQPYLTRESIPPAEVILRAVELLIDEHALKAVSERTWRFLFFPYQVVNTR